MYRTSFFWVILWVGETFMPAYVFVQYFIDDTND